MQTIVLVTNAMTPYRKHFYDMLHAYCESISVKFQVLTMTKQEFGYNWNYKEVDAQYNTLMRGCHLHSPVVTHLNPDVSKHLSELNPDVIILGGSYTNLTSWLVLRYSKKHNVPVYFWSESHLHESRKFNHTVKGIRNFFKRAFYKKCNGFLYAGELSKQFILDANPQATHLHLCPNMIDNQLYKDTQSLDKSILRDKWGLPTDRTIALMPARLHWVKGIPQFGDLLSHSPSKDKITILVPGTGIHEDRISEAIIQAGVDIRLLGYKQQADMLELYALSDLFILPSLSDPNPLSCIEALWSGLPLLVSNHVGNYPEVIKEGENGFVFSYEKPEEATAKIDAFVNSSKEWREKAKWVSMEIAESIYDPSKVVKQLIDQVLCEAKSHNTQQHFTPPD